MTLTAPRKALVGSAVALAALCLLAQWAVGFRVSEGAGQLLELLSVAGYAVAAILLLAPLGRARALMAGAVALVLMAWAVHLNARYATALDLRFGGASSWGGHRVLIATLFVGPLAGLVTGIVTFVLARLELVRWTGKHYAR